MKLIKKFPTEEKFALTDGMKRASRSITENIAEGFGRYHYQENIQFCRICRGSLFELIDQYITALDEEYITNTEYEEGRKLIDRALSLVNGYINYLTKAKANFTTPKNNEFSEEPIIYNDNLISLND